jgi:hypothetical protein
MSRNRAIHTVYADDLLDALTDDDLRDECNDRGITLEKPKAPEFTKAEEEQAEYELDSWFHEVRSAFLARDSRHFAVLMERAEARYRDTWLAAMVTV